MIIREATELDATPLLAAIEESTKNKTLLTRDNLRDDLKLVAVGANHSYKTNKPFLRVLLAEEFDSESHEPRIVGYIAFHYHYSPWESHKYYICDFFIKDSHRDLGIDEALMKELEQIGKKESMHGIQYNLDANRLDSEEQMNEAKKLINKFGFKACRNDESDWSLFKFYL